MVFKEITEPFNCIAACLRHKKCESVNFNGNRKICQLLKGNTNANTDDVDKTTVEDAEWVYYGYKVSIVHVFDFSKEHRNSRKALQ